MKTSIFLSLLILHGCASLELKFELEDSRKDCFYENVQVVGDNIDLVFLVIDGGRKDVTLEILAPNKTRLVVKKRTQTAEVYIKAMEKGVYAFCFSNEFSSFSHKLVYFEMTVESATKTKEQKTKAVKAKMDEAAKATAVTMTALEASVNYITKNMKFSNKGFRNMRKWDWLSEFHAEKLSVSVDLGSGIIVITVFIVSLLQTCFLRRLFSEKRSSSSLTRPLIFT